MSMPDNRIPQKGGEERAITRLKLMHALGVTTSTDDAKPLRPGPVFFLDETGQFVVHICGRHVCLRHVDSNTVNILSPPIEVSHRAITAVAKSLDCGILAVGQLLTNGQMAVGLYDPTVPGNHPRAVLLLPESTKEKEGGKIVSIGLSSNGGSLVVLTNAGDLFHVTEWDSKKGKTQKSSAAPRKISIDTKNSKQLNVSGEFSDVTLCPDDSSLFCVAGRDGYRFVQSDSEGVLKEIPPTSETEGDARIIDHAWLSSSAVCNGPHIIAVSEGGRLLLASPTLTFQLPCPLPNFCPRAVCSLTEGFIVVGSGGTITVWEEGGHHREQEPPYKLIRRVSLDRPQVVLESVDLCRSGEWMVFVTHSREILTLPSTAVYAVPHWHQDGPPPKPVEAIVVSGGFHSEAVTGLSVCLLREVMVTVSREDRTLRIWRLPSPYMVFSRAFLTEEPIDVAIHPVGGLIMAVAFTEKVRILMVVDEDLVVLKEVLITEAAPLVWSAGGQYLAVGDVGGDTKQVVVFGMHRGLAKIATLRVGPSEGRGRISCLSQGNPGVCGLSFDSEDRHLAVAFTDAVSSSYVTEWECASWSRKWEHVSTNGCVYTSMTYSRSEIVVGGLITTPGQGRSYRYQGVLRRLLKGEIVYEVTPWASTVDLPGAFYPTALAHWDGSPEGSPPLLVGTSQGTIDVISGPHSSCIDSYNAHIGPVKALNTIPGVGVVTIGDDRAVLFFRVGESSSALQHNRSIRFPKDTLTISRDRLTAGGDDITKANKMIAQLEKELSQTIAAMTTQMEEEVSKARDSDRAEIEELRGRYAALEAAADAKEKDALKRMRAMQTSQVETTEQLEARYERKLAVGEARIEELERRRRRDIEESQIQEAEQRDRSKREKKILREQFQARLRRATEAHEASQELAEDLRKKYETMLEMETNEREIEVNRIICEKDEEIRKLTQDAEQRLKEKEDLAKGIQAMQQEKLRLANESAEASSVMDAYKIKLEEQSRRIEALQQQSGEHVRGRRQMEEEVRALREKVESVTKARTVVEYRLREISESVAPKDQEIKQLRKRLVETQQELEGQARLLRKLEDDVEQKAHLAVHHRQEVVMLNEAIVEGKNTLLELKRELSAVVHHTDMKEWPKLLKRIYHQHVVGDEETPVKRSITTRQTNMMKSAQSTSDPRENLGSEEAQRQMKALDKRLHSLTRQSSRANAASRRDLSRRATENATLLNEINGNRVRNKNLEDKVKLLELELRDLRGKYQQAQGRNREKTNTETSLGEKKDLSSSKKDRRVHSLRSRQENEEKDKLRHMVEQQTDFIRMQRLEVKMLQEKVESLSKRKEVERASS